MPERVIGIDIGGTKILTALVDERGRIITRERIATTQNGPSADVAAMARSVDAVLKGAGLRREDIAAIGAGAPGPLDPDRGIVYEPPNLAGWIEVPLASLLQQATSLPTYVENDANAAAVGEAWVGAGVGVKDLIFIIMGTGIGGGIILGGQLHQGVTGTAGEIGHITIDMDGPLCGCGRYGHLEALASGKAIARMAMEALRAGERSTLATMGTPEQISAKDVARAAENGDALARDIYRRAGEAMGIAIASVVNLLNPEMVIIGGGVARAGDLVFDPIRRTVKTQAFARPAAAVRIVPSALGDDAGVIGAAAVAYQRIEDRRRVERRVLRGEQERGAPSNE
jgi:glucokinase